MKTSKIGIAMFEIRGKTRKKLFEYTTLPGHHEDGVRVINSKFGMSIKTHSESIVKKMRY